jgi:hypothetical protein
LLTTQINKIQSADRKSFAKLFSLNCCVVINLLFSPALSSTTTTILTYNNNNNNNNNGKHFSLLCQAWHFIDRELERILHNTARVGNNWFVQTLQKEAYRMDFVNVAKCLELLNIALLDGIGAMDSTDIQ